MKSGETGELLDFAVDAAWQAGKITLEYFQTGVAISSKSDQSPVTIADKRGEERIRELIAQRYPTHNIIGEEWGETNHDSPYRWIIDPIDGTRTFVRGVGFYGVLLALEYEDQCILGVANFPALSEMVYAARGSGCYWNGRRARVSSISKMKEALFVTTDVPMYRELGRESAYNRIAEASGMLRTWGDCYGHILVATGRAEIMIDPIMNVWDCAALMPIVQEAGGTFTDWKGNATIRGGDAISTNGLLFEDVIRLAGA